MLRGQERRWRENEDRSGGYNTPTLSQQPDVSLLLLWEEVKRTILLGEEKILCYGIIGKNTFFVSLNFG